MQATFLPILSVGAMRDDHSCVTDIQHGNQAVDILSGKLKPY